MPYCKSFDDVKIHYQFTKKHSLPLVFLHGWTHNNTIWKKEIAIMQKKGYSTLTIDIRGHGLSDKPKKQSSYSLHTFVRDVYAVLKELNIKECVLIGHSMGGMIAQNFYRKHKKYVRALVLITTTYRNPILDNPLLASLDAADIMLDLISFLSAKVKHNERKEVLIDLSAKKKFGYLDEILDEKLIGTPQLLYSLQAMTKLNEQNYLQKIAVPALLIAAENDFFTPATNMRFMNTQIPLSTYVEIKEANHLTPLRESKAVCEHIAQFLSLHKI